ncbi:hypothetical protein Mal64_33760 [Pseudobythopirellula maris]|uniref:Uncharacterized protein n=1 Tax=Pseudobythopirellula maris TaxID=2527991 RepID=A0A5C5ZHF4_9BACT|nr:hypothetical protein [Pseudobythopirellula maris]TWT86550.1 hypothetical protein Mal64_33760 [Pseudobythopirellula maris]
MSEAATAEAAFTTVTPSQTPAFVDRRSSTTDGGPARERRQFTNSHDGLSPDAAELAAAIDTYKLRNRRRFINFEEMLGVVKSLGYQK